jgi:AcrR family transcriptional regulator
MSTTRTRLAPAQRREQLLDLGVQLLSVRRLEDLSIDLLAEEAGISRGLLYHYFASKRDFHLAVLQRMADRVVAITAPAAGVSPREQLSGSLEAFVDFVVDNREAYAAFVRAAAAGDAAYQRIYEGARDALTDRIFTRADSEAMADLGMVDSPALRLMVSGWSSMVEDVLLTWLEDDHGVSKDELLRLLAGSLATIGSIVTATR